jgi:hypothetical protein
MSSELVSTRSVDLYFPNVLISLPRYFAKSHPVDAKALDDAGLLSSPGLRDLKDRLLHGS